MASPRGFQDVASLVAVADTYATTEPFLEGRYDIRIQKIGGHYTVYKCVCSYLLPLKIHPHTQIELQTFVLFDYLS